MKYNQEETPPSSVNGDDEISALEQEDLIYIGDADEVLGSMESDETDESDAENNAEMVTDLSTLIYSQHSGSVFCCDLHPNGKIAVTGGEDDKAYVWDVETGNTLVECSGHKDSVIFVGFSYDGAYVAAADMSGVITVRKCTLAESEPTPWPVVWEYEAGDLIWGLWHYGARVLIFGATSGELYMFKIPSGETKVLQGHRSKVECGKMFPDGRRLAAGYEDGTVKIWDLKSESVVHHIEPDTKLDGITAIDTHPDNNLVITVSPEGKVLFMTASTGKIVGQMDVGVDLETVAFTRDPELGYFAIGSLDGSVSIWDVARQMKRHQCASSEDDDPAGVTKLFWHKHLLLTACLDGSVRVYDGRSGLKTDVLTGHTSELLDICYNVQEKRILTASEDGTGRIFMFEEKTQ